MQKKKIENKRKIIQASNSIETKGFFDRKNQTRIHTQLYVHLSNTIYNQEKSEKNKI